MSITKFNGVNLQNISKVNSVGIQNIVRFYPAPTEGESTERILLSWGDAGSGQLGDGTITDKSSPVQIGSLTDWSQVSGGGYYSLAVKTDGTLWAWGRSTYGQLGDGSTTNKSSPVQIGSLTDWSQVSGGSVHSLAIRSS